MHALQRLHKREPMKPDVRMDALIAAVRAAPRPVAGHRGATPLELEDADLLAVVDDLVARGALVRSGHRVRLPGHEPTLAPELQERVDRLMDGLRESGAEPPRVDGIAARLGVTPAALAQLRQSGDLVRVGPGIDYPRDVWDAIRTQVDRLSRSGGMSVGRLRDELRTSRRHAEAILAYRQSERRSESRRAKGRGSDPRVRRSRPGG